MKTSQAEQMFFLFGEGASAEIRAAELEPEEQEAGFPMKKKWTRPNGYDMMSLGSD